jgi:hypothetical protein
MVARYEQAYPEGVRYYAQADPEGMQLVEQWFNWPDGDLEDQVLIETKVSSATMSKMTRKQEVIALLDKIPQIYQAIMQLGQMAAEPGNPMGIISVKLLGGLQAIFDKFLKEFDVGEREELNPDLIQEVQVVRQIQEAMAQMQQAIQQAQQANANLQAENAWLKGVGGPGGVGGASGQHREGWAEHLASNPAHQDLVAWLYLQYSRANRKVITSDNTEQMLRAAGETEAYFRMFEAMDNAKKTDE